MLAGIVGGDPRAELADLGLDLVFRQEDLADVGLEVDERDRDPFVTAAQNAGSTAPA